MFDIQGGKVVLSTESLAIPPFKDYYNNSTNKELALKEIEYIVFLCKWNTPYEAYPENERASKVAKDIFGDEHYVMSDALKTLAVRFNEFQETSGTRLLRTSQKAIDGLETTLEECSKNAMDIDTALKVTRILERVGQVAKSLDITMKQVKAEQLNTGKIKGGGTIGMYELPR